MILHLETTTKLNMLMPPSTCRERRRVGPPTTSHLAIRIALFVVTVTSSFVNALSRTAAAPVPFTAASAATSAAPSRSPAPAEDRNMFSPEAAEGMRVGLPPGTNARPTSRYITDQLGEPANDDDSNSRPTQRRRLTLMYFRGHENTNTTDEDDSAQTAQPSVSPQLSGWTPSRYPNPRIDPLRCNIRDMITANHGKQVGDRDGSSTSISPEDDEAKAGTVADGSGGEGQHPSNKEDLLLCDPDYALGTHYL